MRASTVPLPEGEHRVRDFDASLWFDAKEVRRVDLFAQFAVAASEMALEDSGQLEVDPALAGIQIGTGVGGLSTMEAQIGVLLEKGPRRVSPFLVPMMMANAGGATVSMRLGWRGPCETITTACASGTHSILAGHRLIATGRCDAVLAGGAEAAMTPVALAAFGNMTALSTSGQSRPFDVRRDGFVIAEGGAVLVLEELERARARGAHIYAELLGGASTADAHHITAPAPGGAGADRLHGARPRRLRAHGGRHRPRQRPRHLHSPQRHGRSRGHREDLRPARDPLVTSIKGVTGHSLGAAGALEAVACALSIERRLIPPTVGLEQPGPGDPPRHRPGHPPGVGTRAGPFEQLRFRGAQWVHRARSRSWLSHGPRGVDGPRGSRRPDRPTAA